MSYFKSEVTHRPADHCIVLYDPRGGNSIHYVVAEINGKPYLTKAAVFSYYEFTSEKPLTDENGRRTSEGRRPTRPAG